MKKMIILAVILMAALTYAATTTNTFTKTQMFSGISISNADGQALLSVISQTFRPERADLSLPSRTNLPELRSA